MAAWMDAEARLRAALWCLPHPADNCARRHAARPGVPATRASLLVRFRAHAEAQGCSHGSH